MRFVRGISAIALVALLGCEPGPAPRFARTRTSVLALREAHAATMPAVRTTKPVVVSSKRAPWGEESTAQRTCRERLDALGIRYRLGHRARGIADPIMLEPELNGVEFYLNHFAPSQRRPLLMDCSLALVLDRFTKHLAFEYGTRALLHFGVYSYRCVGNIGSVPPRRPRGARRRRQAGDCVLSQHALGRAIDLVAIMDRGGNTYRVERDFRANGRPTCPVRSRAMADRRLKTIACWLHDEGLFSTVLTPNFDRVHRSHFHLDLSSLQPDGSFALVREVDPRILRGSSLSVEH